MTETLLEQMPLKATRVELDQEPAVIARVIDSLSADITGVAKQLEQRQIKHVIILGSGDSYYIGLAARHALQSYTHSTISVLQALEFACYGYPKIDEQFAIIVISSSGRKSIIWDAIDRAVTTPAYIIGITDNSEETNPILQKANTVLLTQAEKIGWPTQTTAAAFTVLWILAIEWGFLHHLMPSTEYKELHEQLKLIPIKMKAVLEKSRHFASSVAHETIEQTVFSLIASGPNDGVAFIGSALLSEGPQRFGLALPLEEFHHSLRQYTLQPGNPIILLATHPTCLQRSLETAIVAHDRDALLIGILGTQTNEIAKFCRHHLTIPDVPELLSPLLTLISLQELSIQLAERRVIQGYNRPHL